MQKSIYICYKFSILIAFVLNAKGVYPQIVAQDGTKYGVVKIGKQDWLTTNLSVTTFANGFPILQARTKKEWEEAINEKNQLIAIMISMKVMEQNMANCIICSQ